MVRVDGEVGVPVAAGRLLERRDGGADAVGGEQTARRDRVRGLRPAGVRGARGGRGATEKRKVDAEAFAAELAEYRRAVSAAGIERPELL